jgi:glycine betaine/choline ABC-type transport system substrate-binding protein
MKTLRIILIALCLLAAGCAPRHEGPEIVVTAGTDEEDALLAELTLALLRENGYPVGEHLGLGSARAVRAAVTGGRADLYWAYTADTWRESLAHHEPLADAGVLFRRVAEEDADAGIVWLGPAAVAARPALVVTPGLAEEAGLAKTSDLVRYQAAVNPYLRVCAPEGMQGLAAGVRGLERVYGLRFERRVVTLPVEEGYRALEAGECDCAVGHTSDQAVRLGRLRALDDDRRFYPPSELALGVRRERLEEHPDLEALLLRLVEVLDEGALAALERQVSVQEMDRTMAVRAFLRRNDLLPSWPM